MALVVPKFKAYVLIQKVYSNAYERNKNFKRESKYTYVSYNYSE